MSEDCHLQALGALSKLVIAGWTGRDREAVKQHIEELQSIGVRPPSKVPLFYRAASSLLGIHSHIEVVGNDTSGEVEPLIIVERDRIWLGVGSDHTDRALEAHSVALSKQLCAKPCAAGLWRFDAVADRLDTLEIRAWTANRAESNTDDWVLYQEGTLAAIAPLTELIEASGLNAPASEYPAAMLCGTIPAIGGVRAADRFRFELSDSQSGRRLSHEYTVSCLPVVN